MRKVVITEQNKASIIGMLKKFFAHKDFIYWHTFNGGMKKRIHHHIFTSNPGDEDKLFKYDTKTVYYNTEASVNDDGELNIYLSAGEGAEIGVGDEISFLGNRIIIKSPWEHRDYKHTYLYECYQILSKNDDVTNCREALQDYDDINDFGYDFDEE